MIKTDDYVKIPHGTMFFPRVILTQAEMEHICQFHQIKPAWLKLVVVNFDELAKVMHGIKRQGTNDEAYEQLIAFWLPFSGCIESDVVAFANGDLDLIDLSITYGVSYKQCRKFVKEVLERAGHSFDVDMYWKQHKKHAQKQTTIGLYGVEHTAMRPEVQAKRVATNRKIYGADNPMQIPEIREKLRTRIREEHGVDYTFQKRSSIPSWQKKLFQCLTSDATWHQILQNVCEDAKVPFTFSMFEETLPVNRRDFVISELRNTHVEGLLRLWMEETGMVVKFPENALFRLPFAFSKSWLHYYEKLGILEVPKEYYEKGTSIYEKRMGHYLEALSVPYLHNHKKALHGLEMDFYIPEKRIGIEINPNISHNSNLYATQVARSMFESHKEPSYHYQKYRTAKEDGITLIQLFGNDLEPSVFEHITTKRLKSLLCGYDKRYYARNVGIRKLSTEKDRKKAREFLELYHSQGASRAKEYWVFEYNNAWIGVASFTDHKEHGCAELKRLCFQPSVQIIGGLSKLIAHYFRHHDECCAIYSYSDNSLGNGMAYGKAGATFVKETGPALKFISPKDGHDTYSWQIATSWGADCGVVGMDAEQKGLPKPKTQEEIDAYIEQTLSHRSDDLCGYDRIYTPGSKLWKFTRN